ncbi:DUF6115 domain-containing protein [Bacillus salipaludis]|uniref:DUF6115 domain-containing protein n=1 Tax=Bacillus salipaludis TaxID=2547811 RepID=A0ABW8RAS7_9BACI
MQTYLIEILLGLNLICVIFLITLGSLRQRSDSKEDMYQKINGYQKQMVQEMTELKMAVNHYQQLLKQQCEQWQTEKQILEASIKENRKPMTGQNLLLHHRYQEIFDLQAQGLTVDQIAMKLNKGSGEVAFILQLAAQERS